MIDDKNNEYINECFKINASFSHAFRIQIKALTFVVKKQQKAESLNWKTIKWNLDSELYHRNQENIAGSYVNFDAIFINWKLEVNAEIINYVINLAHCVALVMILVSCPLLLVLIMGQTGITIS